MSILSKLKTVFPGLVAFRNRIYNYVVHYRFRGKTPEEVFETIYKENHWRDVESKSGTGSNVKNTQKVIDLLENVIVELSIKSILDIPCGDFNWMKNVDLRNIHYIGADIVQQLIKDNHQFVNDKIKFENLSILKSPLPATDLIFTRDCLVHFSYEDIFKAIRSVKKSGSKYWMTTTFPAHDNYNILTGDWRPINLQAYPFNLPEPLFLLSEECLEDKRYLDKSLAIWRVADI